MIAEVPQATVSPCHDGKSNGRAAFYARNASVFRFLGRGLQRIQSHDAPEFSGSERLRIAVIVPWVKESAPDSCRTSETKSETKLYNAPCAAFGHATLPPSWSFWVASAAANSDVADFLLFHGPEYDPTSFHLQAGLSALPQNVLAVLVPNMTQLYRHRLGIRVRLTDDKIKDLKPMVGQVFRRYLQRYSHWAFGDIDVVYGRFRSFLTPQVLAHDVITFRTDDICFPMTKTIFAGQLSIFANNNWTRTLYREPLGWHRIALDPTFKFFDERILPLHILSVAPRRVAMVIAQITDRTYRRDAPRSTKRRLIWDAQDGRLFVIRSLSSPLQLVGSSTATCIESEFALAHLSLYKFKHFAARPNTSGSHGFDYNVRDGVTVLGSAQVDARMADVRTARDHVQTCQQNSGGIPP
jgi:hypothetical protein